MLSDFFSAFKNPRSWLYPAWLALAVKYRSTRAGWLWVLAGPSVFIFIVGPLFGRFSNKDMDVFIPYLTTGIVIFSYISALLGSAPSLYTSNKNLLLQGKQFYPLVPLIFIAKALINLLAVSSLIIVVMIIYGVPLTDRIFFLLPAFFLMLVHSFWVSIVLGALGAKFRDIGEAMGAIMRVAFIATPIIWMPESSGRGETMGPYLIFNPIYHVLEPVRAAILGYSAPVLSWVLSLSIAFVGIITAVLVYNKLSQRIIMWV